jgi:hypothetical protein
LDRQTTIERKKNMNNYRSNWLGTAALFMLTIVTIIAMVAALPGTLNALDPGINQPGPAGNVGRDPGINQPGPAGNVGAGVGVDPGINQPGRAGNVGVDPGINQPGRAGNVGVDPGINQPGPAGNRKGIGR